MRDLEAHRRISCDRSCCHVKRMVSLRGREVDFVASGSKR